MQIKHKIDSFLSEVFPDLGLNPQHDRVIDVMVKYYTFGPYKPKVTVTGSEVVIDVAVDIIERQFTQQPPFVLCITLGGAGCCGVKK